MGKYYYDLHVHSCLSPCADNDNTPNNIAGMASLCGLNIVALTDHNTCKNCPAFFAAAKRYGIVPVAGMELTTSEDIHVICLFELLEDALRFEDEIDRRRIAVKNRPDIFGDQLIVDAEDRVIGCEENLLSNATTVSVNEVPDLVKQYCGIAYPAHIDRQSNGIVSVLGTFPDIAGFLCAELHDGAKQAEYTEKYGLQKKKMIVSSDAHYLTDLRDKQYFFELQDDPYSSALMRTRLFEQLR